MTLNDFPLPPVEGEPDFHYILRLSIYVLANEANDPVTSLRMNIVGFTSGDNDNESLGSPVNNVESAEVEIGRFLAARSISDGPQAIVLPSPLDFATFEDTLVVVQLFGNFWEFETAASGLATREEQNPVVYRYFRGYRLGAGDCLVQVDDDQPCTCIAFVADELVSEDPHTKFNLHVHFRQSDNGVAKTLPVIMDPDVENKGGR